MADPFIGEIKIFPYNFAPRDWCFCDGQELPISQFSALFAIISDFYGGNGYTNFAVPNLQGKAPLHKGQGPGLSNYLIGYPVGYSNIPLQHSELPSHNHTIYTAGNETSETNTPDQNSKMGVFFGGNVYTNNPSNKISMNEQSIGYTGGSDTHENRQPYLTFNFCIATEGLFPSRN